MSKPIERPYDIKLEDRGTYLWVLVSGESLNADIAKQYWDEISAKCRSAAHDKILIEKDFVEPVGPQDMIQMAEYVAKVLPSARIAFIDHQDHDDINELGKKLVRNLHVKMQIFDNAAEAERWLMAN
jgi:hypothetical protein